MSDQSFSFEAIGTHWVIDINQALNNATSQHLQKLIHKRIDDFDKTYSRFRKDSLVTKISQKAGTYTFPDDAAQLFNFYKQLYKATDGKVTPLIGNLLSEAGYDAEYSFNPADDLKPVPSWKETMQYKQLQLTTYAPVILDVGAAGKGYLVDLIGQLLNDHGVHSYLIDAGGDMLRKTMQGDIERIGLEHPNDPTQAIGVARLGNGSICGSASNRRKWASLHHIMDPDQLSASNDVLATWVMADTALLADGLATALFFIEPEHLKEQFDFEYCILKPDLSVISSSNFHAELFVGMPL